MGLRPYVELKIDKLTYEDEKYSVDLEDVDDLGVFFEVEAKEPGELKETRAGIIEFIESFGVEPEEINVGKPALMMRRKKAG